MTLIQLETADDMRGRVAAVNSLFVIASNQLGDFRAGLMAAWLGTIPAVLVGGGGALLVVIAGRSLFRSLYRVETLDAGGADPRISYRNVRGKAGKRVCDDQLARDDFRSV